MTYSVVDARLAPGKPEPHPHDHWVSAPGATMAAAQEDLRVALVRIPVCIVVSGFLFTFVDVGTGLLWLASILLVEAGLAFAGSRVARGEFRYRPMSLALVFGTSVCWVVHALLLWRAPDETAHIATLMDLFTISLYGAVSGRNDWRIMVALMALPLTTLTALLFQLLWTQQPPFVALYASLATLGSCGLIVLLAVATNRANAALTAAHASLQEERDGLEQRVVLRTADLERATVEAQAANLAKSQFLATMSHELRTPLNAIIGYAEILQEELGQASGHQKDVARIETAGRHLLAMINDVLDLSRIDAGKMDVSAVSTNIPDLLNRVEATVAHLARANGNKLRVVVNDDVRVLLLDGRKLFQCVVNLAANACKFTEGGEVTVRAGIRDGKLAIDVEDTGCGIPPEQIATLFQPFLQLDSSLTRKHEGSGLGLAITQRLARLMGGDVTLASVPGKGTVATLTVPTDGYGVKKTPDPDRV